jgi:hypothetical protein
MKKDLKARIIITYHDQKQMQLSRGFTKSYLILTAGILNLSVREVLFEQQLTSLKTELGEVIHCDVYYFHKKDLLTDQRRKMIRLLKTATEILDCYDWHFDCIYQNHPYKVKI